jgi:5-methylcytosine-specific restriction endonuclease McrA
MGKRKKRQKQIGDCLLCGVYDQLTLSHLIPRAVFDIIRSADPSQNAPIMMTDKITIMKHGQIKDYLLCQSCERRFNENGEKYAVSMMHTPKGFRLLESLENSSHKSFPIESETAYAGAELGLDMDKLAYFAITAPSVHPMHG